MYVYITQFVYIKEGQEKIFDKFEEVAMSALKNHGGEILLRLRPSEKEVIEKNVATPYEIHFIRFASESEFHNFMHDEERKKFLHLKEQAIKSVLLIKGHEYRPG